MRSAYQEWINTHVPANPVRLCAKMTLLMVAAFPELTRVRGHYSGAGLRDPYPHWWCVDPAGAIVDPTTAQFPDGGAGWYEPHDESGPEPTGKCPNCGSYCYGGDFCCSRRCEIEYRAYIMGELR